MEITNIQNKKALLIFFTTFLILGIYIIYLNFNIFSLKNTIKTKDNLYNIQINNRINELNQLNTQLIDLQRLLDIGLDLSNNNDIYLDEPVDLSDKNYLLSILPSGSPLANTFVTSEFGNRYHPITKNKRLHTGIDFRAQVGTEIYSTADGIVLKSRNSDPGGYGKMLVIMHNYGFKTLYAHMSEVYIRVGDIIPKGTLIGLTGNSGNSTGPHLHYEVKFLEKFINPKDFLYWNTKTFGTIFNSKNNINWKKLISLMKKRKNTNKEINAKRSR